MARLHFTFDYEKSTQALNFFALQAGGRINKMKALKLVFLADRYHLRKYGRLITNDVYVAMKHGPVPSTTRDIVESNDYLEAIQKDYAVRYVEPDSKTFISKQPVDVSVFSESDLEALGFVWKGFGRYDQYQLRDITHSYPEWFRYKDRVANGSCMPMDIMDFFKDPVERVDEKLLLSEEYHKTFELDEEERSAREEELTERSLVESLWR